MARFQIRNEDEVFGALDTIPQLQSKFRGTMQDTVNRIYSRVTHYPQELPNQRYVRTYEFQRSWYREVVDLPNGLRGAVISDGDDADHNIWVMGDGTQAPIHQGRWETVTTVLEQESPQAQRDFNQRAQEILDSL